MRAIALFGVTLVALVLVVGCPAADKPQCEGGADCGVDAAPCPICAPLAQGVCVDGKCAVRGQDDVDVTATVQVDRHLNVQGFAFALSPVVDTCDKIGAFTAFPSSISAYASGQITFDGGTFHDNVGLGRIPGGTDVILLGLGTDQPAAKGTVIAHGCAQAHAEQPAVVFDLSLNP